MSSLEIRTQINQKISNLSQEQLIDKVILYSEPTILCNEQGKQAVLMSLDEFNSWQETLYLSSNPANIEHLQKSILQANAGQKTLES
ncbi:type II toxin-antitoxin system Phd/YefM family antitoxin [Aphanothece sacrum]|uniref:Antitoxin n=1 Tax=Aphanothece sacrum FPU1 TaxID=1920663 RepID=A0A401II51_APHSA|nr:type II toxin-antitoxin system Phd/YefM family antitoxin [Aphanothece sacrum]GBF80791.1 prevent-host-death family protein [Aphanothece sacrum FPU1]GBF83286.1 prevent-host-death family protein [Aphanothece sacrum FPU3]